MFLISSNNSLNIGNESDNVTVIARNCTDFPSAPFPKSLQINVVISATKPTPTDFIKISNIPEFSFPISCKSLRKIMTGFRYDSAVTQTMQLDAIVKSNESSFRSLGIR